MKASLPDRSSNKVPSAAFRPVVSPSVPNRVISRHIVTPHYSDCSSWNDPTHKWHLSTYSFRYFREGYQSSYYSKARFETERIHIDMARLWRALGFEGLINSSLQHKTLRFVSKFWECYLSLIVRAGAMKFVLRAVK